MFVCLFVCLFLRSLSSLSRIFHSYGDVTIAGEGLQILTYARHSWLLGSEGSLACHTYYDTGHSLIMVISEDPCHSHLFCPAFNSEAVTACFYYLGLSRLGFEHPPLRLRGQRSDRLCHRRGPRISSWLISQVVGLQNFAGCLRLVEQDSGILMWPRASVYTRRVLWTYMYLSSL